MVWVLLGSSLFLNVVILLFCFLMLRDKETSLVNQTTAHQGERVAWERERERLLNRCMTKEWESYVQMTGQMGTTSGLSSDTSEVVGMSDESEAARWAAAMGQGEPLGETLVEMERDMSELGLTER